MRRIPAVLVATVLSSSCLLADFTYEQTSKITGGALMSMVKVMGVFSKQMREPMRTTVLVKGDRMAMISPNSTQIVDLASETITEINHQRKTYSVVPFAALAEALKALDGKIKDERGKEVADFNVKASVEQKNETRQIGGVTARQSVLRVEFEGTDKETGEKGTFMTMVADMWLAPEVPGYAEVRSFHERMAQKLAWTPGSGMLSAMAPGSSKGMAELIREASKLEGVPVLQTTRMTFGTPEMAAEMAKQQEAQQQQEPPQEQERQIEAEKPSIGGALGRLGGGRLGGLGGRKKQQPQQAPAAKSAPAAGGAPGSLMEMTTELTSFSSGPVEASKFEVPAGFKQVESEMLKSMRR